MKTLALSKEELRSIRGGDGSNEGFPCKVIDEKGNEKITIATTVKDCLDFGGIKLP